MSRSDLPIPNLIAVLLVGLVAGLSGVLLIANDVVWMAIVTLVLAAVLVGVAVAGLRARLRN
jgi:NhaP-type Na+/H+ and K+/H+ antiporter